MIEIFPKIVDIKSICPKCLNKGNFESELYFQGIHVLGKNVCNSCGTEYISTIPTGHSTFFPVSFTLDKRHQRFDKESGSWMALPLISSVCDGLSSEGVFKRHNLGVEKELILINCLDDCFGHVFTKVWNVYLELQNRQNKTIAVLIPAQCRWLLPSTGIEIWSVNLELGQIKQGIQGLDEWIRNQFQRFNKVLLHPTYIHLNHQSLDFKQILGVGPFDLKQFTNLSPKITFVWREDRFWLSSRFLYFLNKVSIKYKLETLFSPIFIWRQEQLIKRVVKLIKRNLPSSSFTITGKGKLGNLPSIIKDERYEFIDLKVEHKWNQIFSRTHVIIGVHGSHMMIPSTLAAGFIEILPRYKIDHMTEDIAQSHNSRLSHFLGRFVDEYAGAGLISRHVVSLVKKFDFVKRNMESV